MNGMNSNSRLASLMLCYSDLWEDSEFRIRRGRYDTKLCMYYCLTGIQFFESLINFSLLFDMKSRDSFEKEAKFPESDLRLSF
jgi:hypothetical protein